MHLRFAPHVPARGALALALLAASAHAGEIRWESSFEAALARAKAESKIVLVAVNMDGEGANERMAKNVYRDDVVAKLAADTVNVIASPADHGSSDKPCPLFKSLSCTEHRAAADAARKAALKPDDDGNIVAPQHVFLDANGAPLVSVPYEITSGELAWCFVAAAKRADPMSKLVLPSSARMPRRAVIGALYDPTTALGGAVQPVTKKELLQLIKDVKKGMPAEERQASFRRILHSDLPEAMKFIEAELRSGGGGGGGGGGAGAPGGGGAGGGGGGAGGGGSASGDGGGEKHAGILHAMGVVSPAAYWELAAEFLGRDDVVLRGEAAVALEQMAAPAAVKALQERLTKEKDPKVAKDVIRALAACGAGDPKVRAQLVQRLKKEKDDLLRRNTIVALGLVDADPDVRAVLEEKLAKGDEGEKIAAACAMALSRDETYLASLETANAAAPGATVAHVLERAAQVLRGGPMGLVQMSVWTNCQDQIPRERTFGKSGS